MKKRGATLLQFTHHPSAILYAATKPEYKGRLAPVGVATSRLSRMFMGGVLGWFASTGYIQYHSLHDNKLLRVFQGHTDA